MSSASSRAADPALQTAVLPPDRACAGGACAARGSSRSTLTRSGSPSLHSLVAYRTKRRLVAKPKPPSGARAQRELSDRAQRAFVSLFRSRALTLLLSFSRDSQRTKRGKVCARNVASRVIASDSTTAGGRCARASGLGSLLGGVLEPAARRRDREGTSARGISSVRGVGTRREEQEGDETHVMRSLRSLGFLRPANAILVPGMYFLRTGRGQKGAQGRARSRRTNLGFSTARA